MNHEYDQRIQALREAVADAASLEELGAAAVKGITELLHAVGTIIAELEPDGKALRIWHVDPLHPKIRRDWDRMPMAAPIPLADVARTGRQLCLESREEWTERYPHLMHLLEDTGHHANIISPMRADGRVLGAIGCAYASPRGFGNGDCALAQELANVVAEALVEARSKGIAG